MKMIVNILALGLAMSATVVLAGNVEQAQRYSDGLAAPVQNATGHSSASAVVGRAPDSGPQVQVQDLGGQLSNIDRAEVQELGATGGGFSVSRLGALDPNAAAGGGFRVGQLNTE